MGPTRAGFDRWPMVRARFASPEIERVSPMTMDKSLKVRAGAIQARNVLKRSERITRMQEMDRWTDESSVLGMPKVRVQKMSMKKKKKVKKEEEETKGGKKK
jgi:small basic protein (TIGR04137 family)